MASLTADDSAAAASSAPVSQALLKTDVLGRLRVTREHRQRLIEEFERGGTSAARFAQLAGLKYSTFSAWVRRHRRRNAPARNLGKTVRLVEAVAVRNRHDSSSAVKLQLPGGAQLELSAVEQTPVVAALIQALAGRC
jgi:transposase-like protein